MDKVKEQLLIDYKVDKITKEGLKSIFEGVKLIIECSRW